MTINCPSATPEFDMRLLPSASAILLLLSGLFSCELINPEEDIPAYLQIDTLIFAADNLSQGTDRQQIVEVWVTVEDEFLGVYDLPATIPVLQSGDSKINIRAGIKDNGIGRTSEIYPFFQPYETSVSLTPEETASITPTIRYVENVNFAFIEDFEENTNLWTDDLDGNEATEIVSSSEVVFEGNRSGNIELTPENPIVEVATSFSQQFSELQTRGVEVYLEMHYKTDIEIAFGLIAHQSSTFAPEEKVYEFILRPQEEWNKIYLNLSQAVFTLQAESYQITMIGILPPELERANIYLDNIKLVHFN